MLEFRVLGELELVRGGSRSLCRRRRSRARSSVSWWSRRAAPSRAPLRSSWLGPDDPRAALRWSLTKLRPLVDTARQRLVADRERVAFEATARASISSRRRSPATTSRTPRAAPRRCAAPPSSFAASCSTGSICPIAIATTSGAPPSARRRERFASRSSRRSSSASPSAPEARSARAQPAWPSIRSPRRRTSTVMLLARLGRKREALAQYETCARILAAELGTKPSARLIHARTLVGSQAPGGSVPAPAGPRKPAATPAIERGPGPRRPCGSWAASASAPTSPGACKPQRRTARRRRRCFSASPAWARPACSGSVADETRAAGGAVLAGRAFEVEMVRPYGPWVDALRAASLGAALDGLRGDLAALLPELGGGDEGGRIAIASSAPSPGARPAAGARRWPSSSTTFSGSTKRPRPSCTTSSATCRRARSSRAGRAPPS